MNYSQQSISSATTAPGKAGNKGLSAASSIPEIDELSRGAGGGDRVSAFASYSAAAPMSASRESSVPEKRASDKAAKRHYERNRLLIAGISTLLYLAFAGFMLVTSTGTASTGLLGQFDSAGDMVVSWVVPASPAYDKDVRVGAVVKKYVLPTVAASAGSDDLTQAQSVDVWQDGRYITVGVHDPEGSNPVRRWGYALLGLIFVFVGGPVFVKARQRSAATTFYIFCISTAVALAVAMVSSLAYGWAMALQLVSLLVWAASFAYFFFQFPVPLGSARVRQVIGICLVAAIIVLVAGYLWVLSSSPYNYTWLQPLYYLFLAGCGSAGLLKLVGSFMGERSQEVRRQRMLLVVGTALAVGPSLLLGLLPTMIVGRPLIGIDTTAFTLGFLPIFFAYAITQHQLLGIRGFMKRSVVYLIMGFSVLSVFFLLAAFAIKMLPTGQDGDEGRIIVFGLFVFLIAVSFGYVQQRVEWIVDRFIYHDAYDYKAALLQFSTQLAAEQDLNVLSQELVDSTCRMMNLESGTLLMAIHPGEVSSMVVRNTTPPILQTNVLAGDGSTDSHLLGDLDDDSDLILPAMVTHTSPRLGVRAKETMPNVHEQPWEVSYLQAYAHYGAGADWLPEALQSELARQGMDVRHTSAPAELFSFYAGPAYQTLDALTTGPIGRRGNHEETLIHRLAGNRTLYPDSVRQFLAVPLWTRQHFVGILCLGTKKSGERYSKDDLSLLTTLGGQAALAIHNAQLYEMREQALLDTITALAHAIEAKDTYTLNHCERITGRAVALGQSLGLPHKEVENIRLGSILHDVGKIGIPDAILNKPAKLTDSEYEQIKEHAVIGARIVQSVGALQGVVPIIRHHQERFDGSGYPDGLRGDAIPIGARIIAVVDAYGAMTEDRVYRKAPGHEVALSELKRWSGKQFDPYIADAFIRLLEVQPELMED